MAKYLRHDILERVCTVEHVCIRMMAVSGSLVDLAVYLSLKRCPSLIAKKIDVKIFLWAESSYKNFSTRKFFYYESSITRKFPDLRHVV